MKLIFEPVPAWPALAWLARCDAGASAVTVFHGSRVEATDHWFCEAVWDGPFPEGDFDRTDIVAGSGGRVRDGRLVFVSSGSTVDRLNSMWSSSQTCWVSNSLSCLLTVTSGTMRAGYPGYWKDFGSIIDGLDCYKEHMSSSIGPVRLTYFRNLVWDGAALRAVAKPGGSENFETFDDYHRFLAQAMRRVSENLKDPGRQTPYRMLGTLSSGYDSTAVTTLAVMAGCRDALSFTSARSGDPDSGDQAAQALGIALHRVCRDGWRTTPYAEVPFIAADAKGEDRYFRAAEDLLGGRVLFTGFHGDKIWSKAPKNREPTIVRGDRSGLSLTEYRLRAAFIHCPVPFWGARQIADVVRISNSDEMRPWDIGGDYTRPICRRIAEGAGVDREAFGIAKRAASETPFASEDFLTAEAMADFLQWARDKRWQLVLEGRLPVVVSRRLDRLLFRGVVATEAAATKGGELIGNTPVLWRVTRSNGYVLFMRRLRNARSFATPMYVRKFLFPWALERSKDAYVLSQAEKGGDPGDRCTVMTVGGGWRPH